MKLGSEVTEAAAVELMRGLLTTGALVVRARPGKMKALRTMWREVTIEALRHVAAARGTLRQPHFDEYMSRKSDHALMGMMRKLTERQAS